MHVCVCDPKCVCSAVKQKSDRADKRAEVRYPECVVGSEVIKRALYCTYIVARNTIGIVLPFEHWHYEKKRKKKKHMDINYYYVA